MKLYLDNCCFNRPFDNQTQIRIRLETEAKLKIQEEIRLGNFKLVWSYILDYENSKNPFRERKIRISAWRKYAFEDVQEGSEQLKKANFLNQKGFSKMDSLHIACAIISQSAYFLTTDDKILKGSGMVTEIRIIDPTAFIREVMS
jgi:hypothetical protein